MYAEQEKGTAIVHACTRDSLIQVWDRTERCTEGKELELVEIGGEKGEVNGCFEKAQKKAGKAY